MEFSERSRQAIAFVSGAFLALAAFVLVLWAVAWFMPVFLRLSESQWAPLFPAFSFLVISASVVLGWRIRLRPRDAGKHRF
jgi:cytochrome c oxidase assembly factor CtaG